MTNLIKSLQIPVFFSINKSPNQHHIELCFSDKPEKKAKEYIAKIDTSWEKANELYRKNNIYGDHNFLIPATSEMVNYFAGSQSNQPGVFKQIGTDPTTAVGYQKLQLVPCSQHNLALFQHSLQSFPFYIEIGKRTFSLFISHQGLYWKIPCQRHAPMNLSGRSHPVITLETSDNVYAFSYLNEIPWADIAQQLGTAVEPMQLTIPNNAPVTFGNYNY